MNNNKPLLFDEEHTNACHERWSGKRNNLPIPLDGQAEEEWYNNQCGQCIYFVLLQGKLATDWGICSNANTKFDGTVMFEHDGCSQYKGADMWVSSYCVNSLEDDE